MNKVMEIGAKLERATVVFLFTLFSFCSYSAMEAREVLKKMMAVYEKTTDYEVYQRYELFKGEKGTTVESSYEGYFMRNKNKVYQKIDQTEFVVTPEFCMRISHSEKTVELMEGEVYKNREIDFEQTLKECKDLQMTEQEKSYLITMILKKSSQVPFTKVIVKVNKSNYHLSQLDMYYWHMEDFSEDSRKKDLHTPHLRVIYSKFSKKRKVSDSVLKFETYFTKKGNVLSLTGAVAKYELIDQRI